MVYNHNNFKVSLLRHEYMNKHSQIFINGSKQFSMNCKHELLLSLLTNSLMSTHKHITNSITVFVILLVCLFVLPAISWLSDWQRAYLCVSWLTDTHSVPVYSSHLAADHVDPSAQWYLLVVVSTVRMTVSNNDKHVTQAASTRERER